MGVVLVVRVVKIASVEFLWGVGCGYDNFVDFGCCFFGDVGCWCLLSKCVNGSYDGK